MAVLFHKWLFLFLFSFSAKTDAPPPFSVLHPFYVSVTEIHHNSKDKTLEISCKLFADDMEDVLKKNFNTQVDLTNSKMQALNDKLLAEYMAKKLLLAADGKGRKLEYLGFEKEAEAVYCYFEVKDIASVKKLDLTNSILQDFTDKQINIMHVVVNGNRKSYKLDYPHQKASFNF